jgi:hypothetical protein
MKRLLAAAALLLMFAAPIMEASANINPERTGTRSGTTVPPGDILD